MNRRDEQVHMIAHQHPRMNGYTELRAILLQQLKVERPVDIGAEAIVPVVPALNDVKRKSVERHSQAACHAANQRSGVWFVDEIGL